MTVERMAWSGRCEECRTVYVIYPNAEEQTEEFQQEVSTTWPTEGECMVPDCEGYIEWNGNDVLRDVIATRLL